MAPHTINTTVADNLEKNICCTPANSSSLITSATNSNPRVQMFAAQFPPRTCGCQMRLPDCRSAPRHARHLLQSLGPTGRRRPRPMTPSTGNPASIVLMSRSRLDLHQALLANSFRNRRELQFFSTRNAFITILSSRDFTHQNAQTRLLSTVLFL